MPSGNFGPNAAWWAITILAYNLLSALKHIVLGGKWKTRRVKAFRFHLFCLPGRVVEHARSTVIRLAARSSSFEQLMQARERMLMLFTAT